LPERFWNGMPSSYEDEENRVISWRALPDADADNAGSVWFTPVPGGQGTAVRVVLEYDRPEARQARLAKIFGQDAESDIQKDRNELKRTLEQEQ
jgi:uncharacterized membrane protein